MAFGKPGRPPEDQLARQQAIYRAVSPLILAHGVRGVSMRQAAYEACLSIGGLYHYFPTKRDLALHALQPETLLRLCQDFHERYGQLAISDPPAYLEVYLDFLAETALFLRPAIWAALELGVEELQTSLALGMPALMEEFLQLLRDAVPDAEERDLLALANAVRRAVLGVLWDKNVSTDTVRAELAALIAGHRLHVATPLALN